MRSSPNARPRPFSHRYARRPGFVQEIEVEQAFGEALLEGGEGFGGGGHGGRIMAKEGWQILLV